ncbi:MAG: TIGR04255 family protein, partial [Oscillospiraceae bacterium]|nr:TIGR04255 family protein [Oscillospiraceae bacterium]
MFSNEDRVQYAKPQIMEVICQLRFPTILSIGAKEPADFQEQIRMGFPRYSRTEENPMKLVNGKMESQPPVTNYQFLSADG